MGDERIQEIERELRKPGSAAAALYRGQDPKLLFQLLLEEKRLLVEERKTENFHLAARAKGPAPLLSTVEPPGGGDLELENWSKQIFYSKLVANKLGLKKPWEQYGLYIATGGLAGNWAGCRGSVRNFASRACWAFWYHAGVAAKTSFGYFSKAIAVLRLEAITDAAVRENLMGINWLMPTHVKNAG